MRAKHSRCVVVPHRRNWASATPNQAAVLAVQKSGSLKNLVGGCAAGGLLAKSAAFSSTLSMSQMRKKIREVQKMRGHQMLRLGQLRLDWLYFISHWRILHNSHWGISYIYCEDSSVYITPPPQVAALEVPPVEEGGHGEVRRPE